MERRHSTQFVSRLSLKWPNERRHDITTIAATGRERTANGMVRPCSSPASEKLEWGTKQRRPRHVQQSQNYAC
jgi:hypothetical protein